eukprot:5433797-Amphidinium_carterae.1
MCKCSCGAPVTDIAGLYGAPNIHTPCWSACVPQGIEIASSVCTGCLYMATCVYARLILAAPCSIFVAARSGSEWRLGENAYK